MTGEMTKSIEEIKETDENGVSFWVGGLGVGGISGALVGALVGQQFPVCPDWTSF